MYYDLRIVRPDDFLRMDAYGNYDERMTKQLFSDLMIGIAHSKLTRVLIDTRNAFTKLTAAQVLAIAHLCEEILPGPDEHRIAILNRPIEWDRGELFAKIAHDGGWNVKVFKEFEPAFEWLANADRSLGVKKMNEGFPDTGDMA